MATDSFKENLVIKNSKKINEIVHAMEKPKNTNIKATCPPQLPENAGALWFSRYEK